MRNRLTWIDVTDLVTWRGPDTGIQRVARELTKHFARSESARFFVYRAVDRRIKAVPGERLPFLRDTASSAPSLPRSLGAGLGAWQRRLPPSVRPAVGSLLQRARTLDAARQIVRVHGSAASISADDIVLLLGAPWIHSRMAALLNHQRKGDAFKLCYLIYDVAPHLFPHLFPKSHVAQFNAFLSEAIDGADLLLTASTSTGRDLARVCSSASHHVPVKVVRLGDQLAERAAGAPVSGVVAPFLLSVGTIEVRKNHLLLYQMYKLAEAEGIDLPPLVIVGRRGWLTDDVLYAFEHDQYVAARVRLLHDVSDADLAWLYQHCLFTLYPSIYEGWGLPIAESLSHGRVCVASGTSAMPEIAGDLLDYFSPFDPRGCLDMVLRFLNPDVRARKEEEIRSTYRPTSWEQTYREVQHALRSLE